jgi:hypothetical protein
MTVLGVLGTLAARRGDTVEARQIANTLAAWDEPYLLGRNTAWRARIAALIDEREEAMRLLRQAVDEGAHVWDWLHSEPDFTALREYPPFVEFGRPRG